MDDSDVAAVLRELYAGTRQVSLHEMARTRAHETYDIERLVNDSRVHSVELARLDVDDRINNSAIYGCVESMIILMPCDIIAASEWVRSR